MPKRHLTSTTTYSCPYIFGGDAETDVYSISYHPQNSKYIRNTKFAIGKYYVCGSLLPGSHNSLVNGSAFIAQLNSEFFVEDVKLFKSYINSNENTYAATCDYNINADAYYVYGVFATDHLSVLFYSYYSSSSEFNGFTFYYNSLTDSTLISFQLPDASGKHISYYYLTASNGDRQIKVIGKGTGTNNTNVVTMFKTDYDTFHSVRQVPYNSSLWGAYIYQNRTDPSKSFYIILNYLSNILLDTFV